MSTHVDGAAPSVAPDPDDDRRNGPRSTAADHVGPGRIGAGHIGAGDTGLGDTDSGDTDSGDTDSGDTDSGDIGSDWVRAEMQRRMRANSSTRGRHARAAEAASAARLAGAAGPAVPRRERPRPVATPSWATTPVTPGDLPENYVPRHSVQTPGPAAEPAASITGPIPVARPAAWPAAGPVVGGAPDATRGPVVPAQGAPAPAAPAHAAPADAAPAHTAPADVASVDVASVDVPSADAAPADAVPADAAPAADAGRNGRPQPGIRNGRPQPGIRNGRPQPGIRNGRPGPTTHAAPGGSNPHAAPGGPHGHAAPAVPNGHPGPGPITHVAPGGPHGHAAPAVPNGHPRPGGPAAPSDGPLGGPSLTGAGLPIRRRRRSGPGTPLGPDAAPAVGPWTRPGPIVPNEPIQRLGAPPGVLGDDAAVAPWGPPSPPSGLALPVRAPDTDIDAPDTDAPDTDAPDVAGAVASAAPAPVDGRPAGGTPETSADDAGSAHDDPPPAVNGVVTGVAIWRAGQPVDDGIDDGIDDDSYDDDSYDDEDDEDDDAAAPAEVDADAPAEEASGVPAEVAAETTDEIAGGIMESPTAPHPIVLARRAAQSGRPGGMPLPRPAEHARAAARQVTPRPVTPRHIPVIGTAPPEPGSTRVRVVLSERKGVARPVRTIKEVQEGTAVGELLRRDLIRSQLMVTLRFAALTILVLGALPASFVLLPEISAFHVLGVRAPWLLLGVLMYPFLVGLAWRYTRVAERVEQSFADHVQD